MKNIVITLVCITAYFQLSAQEISTKQWTLFSKTTADWCPNCGSWGWNMQKQLVEKFENKNTLTWALHVSGGLTNQAAKDLAANLGVNYHPIFFEGLENMNVTSGNIPTKIEEAEAIVELNNFSDAFAGVGILATIDDDNTLDVSADVEFLAPVEDGNYFLGLYLLEDKLVAYQQNQGQNAVHRYVLRNRILPATFGENLVSGAVAKGQKYKVNASMSNVSGKPENLKVAAIIWNRTSDGKYRFFNANVVDVAITSSEHTPDVSFTLHAQFMGDNLQVTLNNADVLSNVNLHLTDMLGKTVLNTVISNEASWDKTFYLPVLSGTYMLNIDAGKQGQITKKLIKI